MTTPTASDILSTSPKILITRLSAIGDCVHTVPLVHAIRRQWPDAHIGWVTTAAPATLLQTHPDIDQMIVVPKRWMKSPAGLRDVRTRVRQVQWDVVLDPQSLTKSALIGWFSGCRHRIGFGKPQGRELSRWLNRTLVTPRKDHVVEKYLELLGPLGIVDPPATWELGPYPEAMAAMDDVLSSRQLQPQKFAVINTGAGWESKRWPAKRYGAVAKYLGREFDLPTLVVWSGNEERIEAEQIVESSGGHGLLAPDTSLPELAELSRKARIFVGSDTGPLHLAAAVGTPCVAMYGPTDPRVCGPYGSHHQAIRTREQESRGRRRAENIAMRAISATKVCQACLQVLERTNSAAA